VTDPKNPDKPEPPKPAAPYISSKLREKLEESGDKEWSPGGSNPLPGILGTIVVIGILVATFMWWTASNKKQEAARAAAAAAAARQDSLETAARAESIAAVVRADSTAHADSLLAHGKHPHAAPAATAPAKTAATTPAKTTPAGGATKPAGDAAASAATAAPAKPKVPTDGVGIAVGDYMMEDRANSEKDKLSASTGLVGKVVPIDDGGTTMYRVILGKWSSRAPAEARATALIDSSLVHEAKVVARPK
jgi:type II secretory pathway pseudopilin PulG